MADEVKETTAQPEKKAPDVIPYERFTEVNNKFKQTEAELSALKAQIEKDKQAQLEKTAAEKNDYTALKAQVEKEKAELSKAMEEKAMKVKEKMANTVLEALAAKEGLKKSSYLNLFEPIIEIDEDTLEIKNYGDIEKSFSEFKKDNPELFRDKTVPRVDNSKPDRPDLNSKDNRDTSSMSILEKVKYGLEERKMLNKK